MGKVTGFIFLVFSRFSIVISIAISTASWGQLRPSMCEFVNRKKFLQTFFVKTSVLLLHFSDPFVSDSHL